MNRCDYKIYRYYTLEEVMCYLTGQSELFPYDIVDFETIFETKFPNAPIYSNNTLKPYIKELMDLVFSRYIKHYAIWGENAEISERSVKEFLAKMINIIVLSYDKYSTILGIYNANLNKLMDGIKTTTKSGLKYLDTPQDAGNWDSDEYVSNISKTEGESVAEGDSPINRIAEIHNNIRNIMLEWSNEFDKIMVEDANI